MLKSYELDYYIEDEQVEEIEQQLKTNAKGATISNYELVQEFGPAGHPLVRFNIEGTKQQILDFMNWYSNSDYDNLSDFAEFEL